MRRIVVGLITGLKVSSKSKPGIWVNPLTTKHALKWAALTSYLYLMQ